MDHGRDPRNTIPLPESTNRSAVSHAAHCMSVMSDLMPRRGIHVNLDHNSPDPVARVQSNVQVIRCSGLAPRLVGAAAEGGVRVVVL